MRIINLNDRETSTVNARDFYREYMGLSEAEAVKTALDEHVGRPSKAFVEWLSDGTLTVLNGEVAPATTAPDTKSA